MARVTVCIPAYNSGATLPEVLRALDEQEYRDFDVAVCDDGSSDGTWRFLQRLERFNLRVLRNEVNMNLAATMKRLFDGAAGEFVCMHHDHEFAKPDWLRKMIEVLERYPRVGMAVAAYDLILPDGRAVRRPQIQEDVIFRAQNPLPGRRLVRILATLPYTPISAHGAVFRSACVREAGGYSDAWGLASDEDLYRRVAEISDVAYCAEPVVVVVARSRARQFSLGSFKGLYTVFEFRKDTARRYWEGRPLLRTWNLGRLSVLKGVALVREMLYRWLFGTPAEVKMALAWDAVPALPSQRPALSVSGRLAVTAVVKSLVAVPGLGRALGRARRKLQGMRQ